MEIENILVFLDQKITLMDRIAEVTMGMERQLDDVEQLDYSSALATRQQLMERIDKCDEMIRRQIAEFPAEVQNRWSDLCSGRGDAAANEQEQQVSERVSRYRTSLREVTFSSSKVQNRLQAFHGEVKERLNQRRYATAQTDGSIIHD